MQLTAEFLKKSGRLQNKGERGVGVWEVEPPLVVVANQPGARTDEKILINTGERYEVSRYDEDGPYPGYVHLHPTRAFWWPLYMFDVEQIS